MSDHRDQVIDALETHRALLVRALRALATVSAGIPEDADPFDSPDLWIGASGLLACRSVLSDPLAVALLKEADRG